MIVIPEGSASDGIQHSINSEIFYLFTYHECRIIVSNNLAEIIVNLLCLILISRDQALVFPSHNF